MMFQILKYLTFLAIFAFLSGCDSDSKFKDIEDAVKRNKFDITEIIVRPAKTITVGNEDGAGTSYLPLDFSEKFIATGINSSGQEIDISNDVVWSSSNTNIATVSQSGVVTTYGVDGSVSINVTFASIEGIASVQVSTEPLAALEIGVGGQVVTTPYDVDVCTPVQFTALGTYGTNEPKRYITHLVTWEVIHTDSNDPTVTPEPVSRVFNDDAKKGYFGAWATTGAPVKAELKVSLNTIESSLLELNILGSISEININPNGLSIPVSTKHQFTALGKYNTSDSETTDFTDVALWTKDINSNSIDVSTTSPGLVTGVAIGSSPLTVTCGGGTDSVIVTVTESAKMERISIDYTAAEFVTMTQNETVQLKAVAHYSDGRTPEDITENDETSWTVRIIDTDKAQPIIVTSNSSIPDKGNISFNDLGTAIPVGEKRFAEVVVKYSNDLEDDIVVVVTP